jgi:aminomethyltransferase
MLRKTPLHDSHIALGAKMGAFAGYDMPLFYKDGVMKEHEWTRTQCGVFDVSHMGQIIISGAGAAEFLQRITPSSFTEKKHGRAQYTVLTNEQGGIIDDLIITRLSDTEFFIVLNAGCKEKDIAWIKKQIPVSLKLDHLENHALIAVQGPQAEHVVRDVLGFDGSSLPYMHLAKLGAGFISRLGYTGEDGFEISIANKEAPALWQKLVDHADVKPIGLAARDSLRLDMGYCLYGHDINDTTTPLEADLGWVMAKANKDFIGAGPAWKPPARKRVGIKLTEAGVAREGAIIKNEKGATVGALTSGGFSPTLKAALGQGYVETAFAAPGTKVFVNVRDRDIKAEVAVMPFIPAKTKSMKKAA